MPARRGVDIQEWAVRLGYRPVERRPGEVRWWVVLGLAFATTGLALVVEPLRGVTAGQLAAAINASNRNVSAGEIEDVRACLPADIRGLWPMP